MKRNLAVIAAIAAWLANETHAHAHLLLKHYLNKYSTFITCRPYNAFTPVCFGSMVCDGCCPAPMCGGGMPGMPRIPNYMGGPVCSPFCPDPGCLPPDPYSLGMQPGMISGYPMADPALAAQQVPGAMPYAAPYHAAQPGQGMPMPSITVTPVPNNAAQNMPNAGPYMPPMNPNFVPPAPTPLPMGPQNIPMTQNVQPAGYSPPGYLPYVHPGYVQPGYVQPGYAPTYGYPMSYPLYPVSQPPSYWYGAR